MGHFRLVFLNSDPLFYYKLIKIKTKLNNHFEKAVMFYLNQIALIPIIAPNLTLLGILYLNQNMNVYGKNCGFLISFNDQYKLDLSQ
ncbi:hypothetical protein BpHYR1_002940 [Brachionus plicatilis]|uniref:Uncharacterized protein n=1 Tax=Brachionus plicatilis TaxID=10195 RepID=A0A3M7T4A0_BRAPC|nr:hypothetical protein BpHYR1_002940 [Brachionus plicatilis]